MSASKNSSRLELAFDVGHSSIGWAVLGTTDEKSLPAVLGCGSVIFEKDSALAISRRLHRSQRRHVRATRQRIARMEKLLVHVGAFTAAELKAKHVANGGNPTPWLLAARVLASDGAQTLSWPELWDVLRWYAHNRGYEEITGEVRDEDAESDEKKKDAEKVKNAKLEMERLGNLKTMAETICAMLGQDPLAARVGTATENYKGKNCAFPRETVAAEVANILDAHRGKLDGVDDDFITALLKDARKIAVPDIRLARRYQGSLLFGRLAIRYHNRIIGSCPVTYARIYAGACERGDDEATADRLALKAAKLPKKHCVEFLEYRWAMLLAGIQLERPENPKLSGDERRQLDRQMRLLGCVWMESKKGLVVGSGVKEFIALVESITGCNRHNLERLLQTLPDAHKSARLFPFRTKGAVDTWRLVSICLNDKLRSRFVRQLMRGKGDALFVLTPAGIRDELRQLSAVGSDEEKQAVGEALARLEAAVATGANSRKDKDAGKIWAAEMQFERLKGRARYACHGEGKDNVLRQAVREVMEGRDPREADGCLYQSDKLREFERNKRLDEQTNNHLVRHRLLILAGNEKADDDKNKKRGLLDDMIQDYAAGDKSRVARITLEVNRDLLAFSGMDSEAIGKAFGSVTSQHRKMAEKLAVDLADTSYSRWANDPVLIRKARIADDLGWRCPYTGEIITALHLVTGDMDVDHIIPRSKRLSDALEALVVTFKTINKQKGNRTAWEFVEQFQRQQMQGCNQPILPLKEYERFVNQLDLGRRFLDDAKTKTHPDFKRREKRKKLLMVQRFDARSDKEMTPRDLTLTSHITRLAARKLARHFPELDRTGAIIAIPGAVTAAARESKGWRLRSCLKAANPHVMRMVKRLDEKTGQEVEIEIAKPKGELRKITHLHHALDACTLALVSRVIPKDDKLWALIAKRKLTEAELAEFDLFCRKFPGLRETFGISRDDKAEETDLKKWQLHLMPLDKAIKEQLSEKLAERRVVQHLPADMSGMRVEQNTRGIHDRKNGRVFLHQRQKKNSDGIRPPPKETDEPEGKVIGLPRADGSGGKLAALNGVLVIEKNFGVAILDDATLSPAERFIIIPHERVWKRIDDLKARNGGKRPTIVRKGQLVEFERAGATLRYRIFGTGQRARGFYFDAAPVDAIERSVELYPAALINGNFRVLSNRLTGSG